ncbi:MAG: hypothetical protein R6U98_30300 [Pirellulaceae bacterium]
MERCPTQAVLPLVGLAAHKLIRDPYNADVEVWLTRCYAQTPPKVRHVLKMCQRNNAQSKTA